MKPILKAFNINTKKVATLLGGKFEIMHKMVSMHPDADIRAERVYRLTGDNLNEFYPSSVRGAYPIKPYRGDYYELKWSQLLTKGWEIL